MQPNYGGRQNYQQRPQQFHRSNEGGRGGYQGRGGFNGVRPPNNFRNNSNNRNDHGYQKGHHSMGHNRMQNQMPQNNQNQQMGGYQQNQMSFFNQGYFQNQQFPNQIAHQFQNLQFPIGRGQQQFQGGDQQMMFNQGQDASLVGLKIQDISGLPNLANPPAPLQKQDHSKVQQTLMTGPTNEEKYDNLFSSDDENERRAKDQKKAQNPRNIGRSRDDPRIDRKNRQSKSNQDESRKQISAASNLYRAGNDERENSRHAKETREEKSPPYNNRSQKEAPIAAPIIHQWKQAGKGTSFSFQRIKACSGSSSPAQVKFQLSTEQADYLKQICKKVVAQRETKDKREKDDKQKRQKEPTAEENRKVQKTVSQRVFEAKTIAEYFYLLNETNWNKFDDRFYLINRRWFDRWKDFIAFDYIVKHVIELGKSEADLSINRVLQNSSNPSEVSNTQLLLEHREFVRNRNDRHHYCNFPLKRDIVPDRDLIFVTEPIWKFFKERYGGEEIKRYAVYKNPANVLDRSPFLPIVTMCLVIYEEAIRSPKNLVMPRKMRFSYLKTLVKDALSWLKDIPNESVRLWRLHPHLSEKDFIEQYNTQFEAGKLPELLKFPGLSLENSLDFYVEEYGNINLNKHVIFVEVKRPKGQWVFQLEPTDPMIFDEGATDFQHHKSVYSHAPPEKGFYSLFFKYHNNTTREFSDLCDDTRVQPWLKDVTKSELIAWMAEGTKLQTYCLPEHIYFEVFQQMAHNFGLGNLQTLRQHLELPAPDTVSHSILFDTKDTMKIANPNISRDSLRKKKRSPSSESQEKQLSLLQKEKSQTVVTIAKFAVCNSCGFRTPLNQVVFCQACQQTPYCSARCRTKDIRFHEVDCEPQDIIQAADDTKTMTYIQRDIGKFHVSSDESDAKSSDDNVLILEILKSRIDKEVVEDLNQNLFTKRQSRKRKVTDESEDSDFVEGKKKRKQKQDLKLAQKTSVKKSQDTTGPTSENMTSQKAHMSQADASSKRRRDENATFDLGPDVVSLRPINTPDSGLQQLATLLALITQITPLRDSVQNTRMMETDPLCSGLRDIFQSLILPSGSTDKTPFNLVKNPLPHHINPQKALGQMYESLCRQLAKDNSQLGYSLISTIHQICVCLSCGNRTSEEISLPVFQMKHHNEDASANLNVKLKIIYFSDDDNYQKYELRLKPGEYSFQDVNNRIKDLVQNDRMSVKTGKKAFVLVDLFENMAYASQIINEQMKFSFVANQQLTTFAYEVPIQIKQKVKRYHFVHIGKRKADESEAGKIEYFSFPRLIVFGDQDRLSDIAQKILKALKNLLLNSGLDCQSYDTNAKDAYLHYFKQGAKNLFDIVLVLKDGQRWRLDPSVHPSKKLVNTVDLESVIRVECIMAPEAQLDDVRNSYLEYIELDQQQADEDAAAVDISQCFNTMCKQTILEPEQMTKSCFGCGKKAGLQRQIEIGRLSQFVAVIVDKTDSKQRINYSTSFSLDKYVRGQKALQNQPSTTLDLVGLACENTPNEENKKQANSFVLLRHKDPSLWTKHSFGRDADASQVTCENPEEMTSLASIKFVLYRKEQC